MLGITDQMLKSAQTDPILLATVRENRETLDASAINLCRRGSSGAILEFGLTGKV